MVVDGGGMRLEEEVVDGGGFRPEEEERCFFLPILGEKSEIAMSL